MKLLSVLTWAAIMRCLETLQVLWNTIKRYCELNLLFLCSKFVRAYVHDLCNAKHYIMSQSPLVHSSLLQAVVLCMYYI